MKTAIVILNWNTKYYLEQFLPLVIASAYNAEVIVADNGSTDGSTNVMKEKFPNIRLISFDKNYGFTGGYIKAFEAIKQEDFEYYVLLNTDIQVTTSWLQPLTEWMDKNPHCGGCGPKLMSFNNREYFEYAGAAGGLLDNFGYPYCRGRIINKIEIDKGQYNNITQVHWVSGACLMIRAKAYWDVNGLDKRFFAHMEEIDLCWKMQLIGYQINIIPTSTVYHIGGGTLSNNSPFKLQLNYRNNLLMLQNNLAKTFSLTMPTHKAIKKANRKLFQRKLLDAFAAMAYILMGKFNLAKAVYKAHKEFDKLNIEPSYAEIEIYAKTYRHKAEVKGLTNICIIPQSIFNYKGLINKLHNNSI